ncbi:MAG: dephospho-CoA kinase [Gammaproteobacteria bacterium]
MDTTIIGVTGGIGSGKSAVCREFEKYGIVIVDADIASREVVLPGSAGLNEIVEHFGTDVLNDDGSLDRAKLRDIVFNDAERRNTLESILHPKIRQRIVEQLQASTSPYTLLCVPLMIERGNSYQVDRLLVIDCPEETQIARVMDRDNLTREQVLAIMATQATRQQRLDKADDIIMNDGPLENLSDQVKILHQQYMALSSTK